MRTTHRRAQAVPGGSRVVELFGLPGAGKSSLAAAVAASSPPSYRLTPFAQPNETRRLLGKAGAVAMSAGRHPLVATRMGHAIALSRQPSVGQASRRYLTWLASQHRIRSHRHQPGMHLVDEGVLQSLWSIGLEGDLDRVLDTLGAAPTDWVRCDLAVVLDTPAEVAIDRVRRRESSHSRLDRIERRGQATLMRRGSELIEGLVGWYRGLGGQVISLGSTGNGDEVTGLVADEALRALHSVLSEQAAASETGAGT